MGGGVVCGEASPGTTLEPAQGSLRLSQQPNFPPRCTPHTTMAGLFKNMFGGSEPSAPARVDDGESPYSVHWCMSNLAEFADFVNAPGEAPPSFAAPSSTPIASAQNAVPGAVAYTKWYRVWERTSPKDFVQEALITPFLLIIVLVHLWGTRKNRRKAKEWATTHGHTLQNEFAVVGFDGVRRQTPGSESMPSELVSTDSILKEKSAQEFAAYATGRQNVAFVDVAIKMPKRYNPIIYVTEYVLSFFFDSWATPADRMEATAFTFDGKEKDLVPVPAGDSSGLKVNKSTYDGFIWAIVHKNCMRTFRQDRYDASMTFTKDNPNLPSWVTVMTESAEITDTLLTPELTKAVEQAGNDFEYLIVSDQPVDKPTK